MQRVQDVGDGLAAGEAAVHAAAAPDGEMAQVDVGIHEAGNHEAVTGVADREAGRAGLLGNPLAADGLDAAIPDQQGPGVGRARHRGDAPGDRERRRRGLGVGHARHPASRVASVSSRGGWASRAGK